MSSTYVVQRDELFRVLYEAQEGKISVPAPKISATIGSFRKTLSLAWLKNLENHDALACLSTVIATLIQYTEHSDASVRVIAYSTLGALLLCVAPFDRRVFIRAFGVAAGQAPVSPRSSIAIINMFVYLSKFVSPVELQAFIIVVPVLKHFKADVSDFLKYLPQIIPMMRNLPVSFQQCFLENLLITCSKRLNSCFTGAVSALISLDKKHLVPSFIEILKKNKMTAVIGALGPTLMSDKEICEILEEDGRELFLSAALNEFDRAQPRFIEFESACLTCFHFLRYTKGTPQHKELKNRIFSHLRKDYPPHFNRLRMLLPMSLEDILAIEADSDSMKAAQLTALANLLLDHPKTVDPDEVAKIFLGYSLSRNDLYCSLLESFKKCISLFLEKCTARYHIELLMFILKKENINWVHDMAVAKLLKKIDSNICSKFIPNYFEIAIERLLSFAVSPNNKLFSATLSAIREIVSYDTIDQTLLLILHSDFTDDLCASRRFELLSLLSSIFKSSLFELFVPIAYECLLLHESVNTISMICSFLASIQVPYVTDEVLDFCFRFISCHFETFTQVSLDHPELPAIPGRSTFLDTVDTDIVTNPVFDHQTAMGPMRHCFEFLCSIPIARLTNHKQFFQYCIDLVPLFDKYALSKASELVDACHELNGNLLWDVILDTFKTTSDHSVVAACCKLMSKIMKEIPSDVEVMIEKYLIEQTSTDPELLYYCFVLVDQHQHDKAIQAAPTLAANLSDQTAAILLFKLVRVIGRGLVDTIADQHAIALLQFANFHGGSYSKRVQSYLDSHAFADWPLDESLNEELVTFLRNSGQLVKLCSFDGLDFDHWRFIISHAELFESQGEIVEFIKNNPKLLSKIDTSNVYRRSRVSPTFEFQPVEKSIPVLASASPLLEQGTVPDSVALLRSFLQSSCVVVSQNVFDDILSKLVSNEEGMALAIEYAMAHHLTVSDDFIVSNRVFQNEDVFLQVLKYWKCYGGIDKLPDIVKQFIAEKLHYSLDKIPYEAVKDAVIALDPQNFLASIIADNERFCFRKFRRLLSVLYEYDFNPVTLHELASIHLSVFSGITSLKKRAILIRFDTCAIDVLRRRNLTFESGLIEALVAVSFDIITEAPSAALEHEIGKLLQVLVPETRKVAPYSQYITGHYSRNLVVPMVMLYHYHQFQLKSFVEFFCAIRPSRLSAAFKCLEMITDENAPPATVEIINSCISVIFRKVSKLPQSFWTVSSCIPALIKLHNTREKWVIPDGFFETIAYALLSDRNMPYYEKALGLCSCIIDSCPKIIDNIFSLTFSDATVLNTLWNLYALRAGDLVAQKAIHDRILAFFIEHPQPGNAARMAEAACNTHSIDSTGCFILNHIGDHFLPYFTVLSKLAGQSPTLASLYQSLSESLTPKSRAEAVAESTSNPRRAFLLAAAETDTPHLFE